MTPWTTRTGRLTQATSMSLDKSESSSTRADKRWSRWVRKSADLGLRRVLWTPKTKSWRASSCRLTPAWNWRSNDTHPTSRSCQRQGLERDEVSRWPHMMIRSRPIPMTITISITMISHMTRITTTASSRPMIRESTSKMRMSRRLTTSTSFWTRMSSE